MALTVCVGKITTMSMNLIVSPRNSVSVSINLNVSSSFGVVRYMSISMRMIFKVNPSNSR